MTSLDLEPLKLKVNSFKHEGPDSLLDPSSDTFNLQDYLEDLAFQAKGELSDKLQGLAYLIRKWPFDEISFKSLVGEIFKPEEHESCYGGFPAWLELKNFISTILFSGHRVPLHLMKLVEKNIKIVIQPYSQLEIYRADIGESLKTFFDSSNKSQVRHFSVKYLESESEYKIRMVAPAPVADLLHDVLKKNYWKYEFDGTAHNFTLRAGKLVGEEYLFIKTPEKNIAIPSSIVEGIIPLKHLSIGILATETTKVLPPQKCHHHGKVLEIDYVNLNFWQYPNLALVNNGYCLRAFSLVSEPYYSKAIAQQGFVKSPCAHEVFPVFDWESL